MNGNGPFFGLGGLPGRMGLYGAASSILAPSGDVGFVCYAVGCSRGEFVSFGGKAGPGWLVCASVDVVMERVCFRRIKNE